MTIYRHLSGSLNFFSYFNLKWIIFSGRAGHNIQSATRATIFQILERECSGSSKNRIVSNFGLCFATYARAFILSVLFPHLNSFCLISSNLRLYVELVKVRHEYMEKVYSQNIYLIRFLLVTVIFWPIILLLSTFCAVFFSMKTNSIFTLVFSNACKTSWTVSVAAYSQSCVASLIFFVVDRVIPNENYFQQTFEVNSHKEDPNFFLCCYFGLFTDEDKIGLETILCTTYCRTQMYLSKKMASLRPEITMPMFSGK